MIRTAFKIMVEDKMCGIEAYQIELTKNWLIADSCNSLIYKIFRKRDRQIFALKIYKNKFNAYQKLDYAKFIKGTTIELQTQ